VPAARATDPRPGVQVDPKASVSTIAEDAKLKEGATNKFGFQSATSNATLADNAVALTVNVKSAGAAVVADADLKAVSSNSAVKLAWAYDEAGAAASCLKMDNTTGSGQLNAFATSDIVLNVPDTTDGTGDYRLCFAGATSTSYGTSTVTISAAAAETEDWVVLKTITVTAIGPVATLDLAITDSYRYVAEDNVKRDEWLTLIGKDAAGTIINGATGSISAGFDLPTDITEDTGNPDHNDGDTAINFFSGSAVADDADGASTLYDLLANTCLSDDDADYTDAGTTFALSVANAAGTVTSNSISVTCTTNTTGVARVTAVTAEATTGAKVYNETATGSDDYLDLYATVVDEDGRPMGDGAAAVDFVWTLDGAAAIEEEFIDYGAEDPTVDEDAAGTYTDDLDNRAVGGKVKLGVLCETVTTRACVAGIDFGRLGKFTYTLEAADSDLATTTNVAAEFVVTYTATGEDATSISRTRNAAKTRATITADMGEANAFERIEFYVELANGNVKTYTRRANASGIATIVQVRRNTTVYVYADLEDGGGSPTDVLKVVFK
jgi:hypothetical protein